MCCTAYRLLAAAEAVGLDGHRAVANQCIGTLHGEASNVEELRHDERSLRCWRAAGGSSAGGLRHRRRPDRALSLHDCARGARGLAGAARRRLQRRPALRERCRRARISRRSAGSTTPSRRSRSDRSWTSRATPCARLQWNPGSAAASCVPAAATPRRATLARAHLEGMPNRPIMEFPYDVYQLNDVIRIACEALGDAATAAEGRFACTPGPYRWSAAARGHAISRCSSTARAVSSRCSPAPSTGVGSPRSTAWGAPVQQWWSSSPKPRPSRASWSATSASWRTSATRCAVRSAVCWA